MASTESLLFPALLKYWRRTRGLSQLDLALAADVSSRHVSFLETGRASPSRGMVLRLGTVLAVPLRDQNIMLRAAGHESAYASAPFDAGLPAGVEQAITRMSAQQEPFPLLILNRGYDILRLNGAAERLVGRLVAEPSAMKRPANILRMLFDPRLTRPFLVDWEAVARTMLQRVHREVLARPSDANLVTILQELFSYPDVPEGWREPDLSSTCEPTCTLRFKTGSLELSFLSTLTVFNVPQDVTVEEIRIESYFALDEATVRACERLARHS
jgi:transcriptional regulator with XRE-family HTH domain